MIDIHIKLWQLIISILGLLFVLITGWISINLEIKELQVNQAQQIKQIELNVNKIDRIYSDVKDNQIEIMREMYDIKIILKDKENRNK